MGRGTTKVERVINHMSIIEIILAIICSILLLIGCINITILGLRRIWQKGKGLAWTWE